MGNYLIPTSRLDYLRLTGNATAQKLSEESGFQQYEIHVVDNAADYEAYADMVDAEAAATAISVSEADATAKADAAEAAAIASASADATAKADDAEAAAIATASADATAKADAAQAAAIAYASTADRVQLSGISSAVGTALTAGNFSTAMRFYVDRTGCTLSGVKFWWPGGASRTIKVSVWDAGGVRLGSTTVAVSAAGIYTAVLNQALTAGVIYRLSLWDNSGVSYLKTSSAAANVLVPPRIFYSGGGLYYEAITYYGAGDTFPNSTGAEAYIMDPLITP